MEPGRAARLTAAVLIMLGAAAAAVIPIAVSRTVPVPHLTQASLIVGALLGGAATVRRGRDYLAVLTAAPLAIATARAILDLAADRPLGAAPVDAVIIAAATGTAALGAVIGQWIPLRLRRVAAAGFIHVALQVLTVLLLARLDSVAASLLSSGLMLTVSGAVAIRLVPDATPGEVSAGWPLLAIGAVVLTPLFGGNASLILVALATLFILPVPMALAAIGAGLARPTPPLPSPDLPPASVLR